MNKYIFYLLLTLASCSNYVNSIHRQIDKDERSPNQRMKRSDSNRFGQREQDRFKPEKDKRPIQNPMTFSLGSDSSGQMRPPVKREYRPQRYRANDFVDNENTGSLWANQGSNASLFTYQNDKRRGDFVIVNVLENLRNQISSELKRTFPDKPKKPNKDSKDSKEGKDKKSATNSPTTPNQQDNEMDMKVYDKISAVVMEEVSKDYILLKGLKEVIFKKEKTSIEIQALVSRKDIMENDYVNSDKLLESKVFVRGRNSGNE